MPTVLLFITPILSCTAVRYIVRSGPFRNLTLVILSSSWRSNPGVETLSTTLGQLARNPSHPGGRPRDQVFLVGFHGNCVHIARGIFAADSIASAWLKRFLVEPVLLQFSRGYNLLTICEASRGLVVVLRYLLSRTAKVGVFQAHPHIHTQLRKIRSE